MRVKILHNPRCSKSRATLDLLKTRGVETDVVEYLKSPPGIPELREILRQLGMRPRQILRSGEAIYKELGLDDPNLDDDALLEAMVQHPILIERPIVLANGKAAIGRPPENVLAIL